MQGLLAELQNARATLDSLIEQLRDQGANGFAALAAPIFEAHPEVKSFEWHQYTPYFNDGDECTFEVYTDYVTINGEEEVSTSEEVGYRLNPEETEWSKMRYGRKPNPNTAAVAIGKLLKTLGDDTLKAMFGDHVAITVTRDNVTVEAYGHD